MATYDLEQQEQIDQAKHFWKKYGNLITWTLVIVLAAYAAWTGYLYWQNDRATKAAALYEELDRAALSADVDKTTRVFDDLKAHAGATYTEQGALLAARVQADAGKTDQARASLQWLVDNGKNEDLVAVARLRLAGLLLDAKQYDAALKLVDAGPLPAEFQALADDRRGDILSAQGKKAEAVKAYQAAYKAMDPAVEYRRFIEGKLTALGKAPAATAPQSGASAASAATAP